MGRAGAKGFKAKGIQPDHLRALIDAAHRHGLSVTGHLDSGVRTTVNPREAILMGIDRIEHFLGGDAISDERSAYASLEALDLSDPTTARQMQDIFDLYIGKPAGFIERQVGGWFGRWEKAKAEEVPAMEAVHRWLAGHLPPEGAPALIHNDYKLDNSMFATDDPGRLVAVFDWDMATLGDPLSDLGALLAYWIDEDDPEEVRAFSPMPHHATGFPSRTELIERYAGASGRDVSSIRFYHVLGLYRLAVILAQIHIRWLRGQTRDERFAGLGDLVKLIAVHAEHLAA